METEAKAKLQAELIDKFLYVFDLALKANDLSYALEALANAAMVGELTPRPSNTQD